jgi:hypothetical protein
LIFDIDVTVKPLYSQHEGAVVSYTTHKNPAASAMFTTPILWQIYASVSASKCARAMNMQPLKVYSDFGKC